MNPNRAQRNDIPKDIVRAPRDRCNICMHPLVTCYCQDIIPFDPKIRFVILIHWREARRRIATGRMSHLFLKNSLLLEGNEFTHDARVNRIIDDVDSRSVLLYPGLDALNMSSWGKSDLEIFAAKPLNIFLIDGTWINARKTVQRSPNLQKLPKISFDLSKPSRFRLRMQPRQECLSTLEAIHQTIELMGTSLGFDLPSRAHDRMLEAFDKMEARQIELARGTRLELRLGK